MGLLSRLSQYCTTLLYLDCRGTVRQWAHTGESQLWGLSPMREVGRKWGEGRPSYKLSYQIRKSLNEEPSRPTVRGAILRNGKHSTQFVQHLPRATMRDTYQVGNVGGRQLLPNGEAVRDDGDAFGCAEFTVGHDPSIARTAQKFKVVSTSG